MSIQYTLRYSQRARALRVAVYPGGEVVVVAPRRHPVRSIERFVSRYQKWIQKQVERTKGTEVIRIAHKDISVLKCRAAVLAHQRAMHFGKFYGVTFRKITIRAQKARWGSCSREGNLSFNYKIAALPPDIADYIIVHELCHLMEMNHSKKFWAQVERAIPRHTILRSQLRRLAFVYF